MKIKGDSVFALFGITLGEIMFKPRKDIDNGFSVVCLRCAGKTGASISLEVADGLAALACSCGNLYVE